MKSAIAAGISYFALVFSLGFLLGIIRVIWLEPMAGTILAVVIELPFMLAASWFVCLFLVRRFHIVRNINERLIMGLVAFGLLMLGELLLSMMLQNLSPIEFLQKFELPENRLGLAGQIAFALFPIIQRYGAETVDK